MLTMSVSLKRDALLYWTALNGTQKSLKTQQDSASKRMRNFLRDHTKEINTTNY
jgi:hypothetical protein